MCHSLMLHRMWRLFLVSVAFDANTFRNRLCRGATDPKNAARDADAGLSVRTPEPGKSASCGGTSNAGGIKVMLLLFEETL
jgi:hypothetical protein